VAPAVKLYQHDFLHEKHLLFENLWTHLDSTSKKTPLPILRGLLELKIKPKGHAKQVAARCPGSQGRREIDNHLNFKCIIGSILRYSPEAPSESDNFKESKEETLARAAELLLQSSLTVSCVYGIEMDNVAHEGQR
jgi:hypothetical protein